MNNVVIPTTIEKMDRDEFLTYIDTTPNSTATFKILGIGITDYAVSFNPQVDQEKWIIEKNARNIHRSNQKQGSVTQTIYKGDPCFEFVAQGRDQLNYKTKILDVDTWNGTGSVYPATLTDGIIAVTEFGGEDATISYDLYYNGNPTVGTVTFDGNGNPTFQETASL